MRSRSLALLTSLAVATTACAGRTWPTTAVSAVDPGLPARSTLTVDVLPADISVWAEPGVTVSPDEVRGQLEARVLTTAFDAISQRAYGIQAVMDRTGRAGQLEILAPDALHATLGTLAAYGDAGETALAPQLPARLGEVTGADATLYVGGWAYLAPKRESTGEKVAKGVVVALAVVAVVAVVAIIASGLSSKDTSTSKSKSKSKSSGSKERRGGASFRESRPEEVATIRDHRGKATIRDHRDGARGGGGWITDATSGNSGGGEARIRDHRGGRNLVRDRVGYRPYASSGSRIEIDLDAFDSSLEPEPEPPPSGESRLFLQMTLVDNRTGGVLWHAHQTFPANPARPGDAARAAKILLASLPAR